MINVSCLNNTDVSGPATDSWSLSKTSIAILALSFLLVITVAARAQEKTIPITITTNLGIIKAELYPERAPLTVANFLANIDGGLYQDGHFYRALQKDSGPLGALSLIQGGKALNREARPAIAHETTKISGLSHTDGVLSMARLEPGTASSEFFICVGDNSGLDSSQSDVQQPGYAAFGRVTEGMNLVRQILLQPVGHRGANDALVKRAREEGVEVIIPSLLDHSLSMRVEVYDSPNTLTVHEQALALYEKVSRENARVARVNGIDLGYLDFGPESGTPLIWAHGTASTSYEIVNVKDGLIDAGYRVIAIDYRGHGNTQIPITDFNTSLYHVADDVAALMDHLSIQKAVIGGFSKGGFVAAAFYDTYPERTLGLLLEDGGTWSNLARNDDVYLQDEANYDPHIAEWIDFFSTTYKTRMSGFNAFAEFYQLDELGISRSVEVSAWLMAMLKQKSNGLWVAHVDLPTLVLNDGTAFQKRVYSKIPMMERSMMMMQPSVIFRNLQVPIHIIDPTSENDYFPVTQQNAELQKQHPALIVHEIYKSTPHSAHIKRPDWFVKSAEALLKRIKDQQQRGSLKDG